MKKLYLAVVFSFLFGISYAKADLHADYVKVECNKTFGFIDIQNDTMFGRRMVEHFGTPTPYFKYSAKNYIIDSDIYLINSFFENDEDFIINCELSFDLSYIVKIHQTDIGDCQYDTTKLISITEIKKGVKKELVNEVAIGCEGKVDRIVGELHYEHNVLTDKNAGLTVLFSFKSSGVYFNTYENVEPITDEIMNKKYKEDQQRVEELEKKEQLRNEEYLSD